MDDDDRKGYAWEAEYKKTWFTNDEVKLNKSTKRRKTTKLVLKSLLRQLVICIVS
jgi:hypothetical protein